MINYIFLFHVNILAFHYESQQFYSKWCNDVWYFHINYHIEEWKNKQQFADISKGIFFQSFPIDNKSLSVKIIT